MINKKNVTLSIDKKTYDKYKKLCKDKGWVLSKRVEFMMENELKE